MRVGDRVDSHRMAGGVRLEGAVTTVAEVITDNGNLTGANLLANVDPAPNWVRLARRVPVRITIDIAALPKGMRAGHGHGRHDRGVAAH